MGEERHDLQDRKGTQPPRAVYFARMSLGGKMCREMGFGGQRSRLASSVAAFLLSPKNQRSLQGSAARRGVLSRLATCHLAPFTQPRPPPQAQALPCLLGSPPAEATLTSTVLGGVGWAQHFWAIRGAFLNQLLLRSFGNAPSSP